MRLKSTDEAIEQFNQLARRLLRTTPDRIPTGAVPDLPESRSRRIDKICTNRKDWKAQERNYRKMIKRMPKARAGAAHGRPVARAW